MFPYEVVINWKLLNNNHRPYCIIDYMEYHRMYFSKGLCNEAEVFACNTVKVILLSDAMFEIVLLFEIMPARNKLYNNVSGGVEEIFAYYCINFF